MPHLHDHLDPALRFGFFCHDNQAVVRLDGELDVLSLADAYLALELTAATHTQVTVDCSGLQFVDMAGFRFLSKARDQAQASGGDLIASDPVALVHRLSETIGQPSPISLREPGSLGIGCSHVLDPAATRQAAIAAALRLSGASMGNLQLVDPTTGQLRIVAQRGFGQQFLDFFATVRDTSSACGTALKLGIPVWVDDVATSSVFDNTAARQVMIDAGARAVVSLPIREPGGTIIAVVSVHYDRPVARPRCSELQLEQLAWLTGSGLAPLASVP